MTRQGKVEAIYTLPVFLLSQAIFENKNKICVWGCGACRQSEIFLFLKIKFFLYYLKGLTGVLLDITIVFTITGNV